MKKYIAIATLLAAGSAFANAEVTVDLTNTTTASRNQTGYTAFDFKLDASWLNPSSERDWQTALDAAKSATLNSVTLTTANTWSRLNYGYYSLAIFEKNVEGSSNSWNFVGASEWYQASASEGRNTFSFGESGIELGIATTYTAVFYISSDNTTALDITNTLTSLAGKEYAASGNNKVQASETPGIACVGFNAYKDVAGAAVYVGAPGTLTNDIALPVSFNVSAIPEPSAFGLLAGLGALALVGTRRRRK